MSGSYGYSIADSVLLSCVVLLLAVNVVGYVVLADLELSVKADILIRHGELALVCNVYVSRLPTLKGIACLFRAEVILYIYRGINLVGLLLPVLDVINIVGYVVSILNPLCIQILAGHQRSRRVCLGALLIGVPTAEGVVVRRSELSKIRVINVLSGVLIAARCRCYLGILLHTGDSILCIVGMIGNRNRYTSEIAINMDTVRLILNGIPYNGNLIRTKREIRGIKQRLSGIRIGISGLVVDSALSIPVARSEETEIVRYIQIAGVIKAILVVKSVNSALAVKYPLSLRSYRTGVTRRRIQTLYATVAARDTFLLVIAARQVVFLTLAMVVIRRTAFRQKYEVLGIFRPKPCEVDVRRCHADFIFRRIAYYIIFLRNVSRTFGNGGISAIARLRAVRTAVCAAVRRSRCGVLTLGRLFLGHRRSGISGSFSGVCCGSGINHRHCDFFVRRKSCDALIVGQRPARAHGQHHDSRKSSCEQTFARILF